MEDGKARRLYDSNISHIAEFKVKYSGVRSLKGLEKQSICTLRIHLDELLDQQLLLRGYGYRLKQPSDTCKSYKHRRRMRK